MWNPLLYLTFLNLDLDKFKNKVVDCTLALSCLRIHLDKVGDITENFSRWAVIMKKILISFLAILIFSTVTVEAAPEYAKWGKIAVEETQKRYNAVIIDYKHIGRTELTPKKSEEKFKLWIRSKAGNEFGVFVSIQFDPLTDTIQSIQFSETNR